MSIVDDNLKQHNFKVKFDHKETKKGKLNIHKIEVNDKECNRTFNVGRL